MDGFVFDRQDDETLVISLNGKEIVCLNHDEDGWQGMERGENIIRSVASALNIKVTERTIMSDEPMLIVSFEAVQAARTEVTAYEAAGISDKIDPMVRRIAEAKAVSSVEKSEI